MPSEETVPLPRASGLDNGPSAPDPGLTKPPSTPSAASTTRAGEPETEGGTLIQDEVAQDHARLDSSKTSMRPPLVPVGYKITRQLGRGTFGEVWQGEHEKTKVQVAIKFFHSRGPEQWQALADEAKKLALLHSDQRIVRLIEIDADAATPFFVMDFAEQGSLKVLLAKGSLPVAEALRIFREVVEAMAYVHAKGIRHCDLKPGNVLLDAAGRPRIADFGQSHLSIEPTASALGTFFYMAPEQASSEKQVADTRWDVFGLGALFYAMVTGQPPRYTRAFKEELEQTQQLAHRLERYRECLKTAPPPEGHHSVDGMDRPLADLIDRCLDVDPRRRPRDAGDILAALDQRERRRRMRPLLVFAVLAPLLLMAAAGLFGYLLVRTSVEQAEQSITEHLLQSDQVTANLVANVVRDKLSQAVAEVDRLAKVEKLGALLQSYLQDDGYKAFGGAPQKRALVQDPGNANLKSLEEQLQRVGDFVKDRFNSVSVFDAKGNILAFYVGDTGQFDRTIYGNNYSYRDYFNRTKDIYGDDAARYEYQENPVRTPQGQRDPPYIGQPYVSTTVSRFMAITVSAPIYADPKTRQERIGLFLGTIELKKLNSWIDPVEEKKGSAVLLDRRGYCVHHNKKFLDRIQPDFRIAPHKWSEDSPNYQRVLAGEELVVPDHVDPFDRQVYLAAAIPVKEFGWGVVVQHNRQEALSEINGVRNKLMGYIWLAGGLSGLLLSAFWGWLLWLLLKKERIAHA